MALAPVVLALDGLPLGGPALLGGAKLMLSMRELTLEAVRARSELHEFSAKLRLEEWMSASTLSVPIVYMSFGTLYAIHTKHIMRHHSRR